MRSLLAMTLAVAALVAALAGVVSDVAPPPPPAGASAPTEVARDAAGSVPEVGRSAAPAAEPAWAWRARCVDDESGRPVPGCDVRAAGRTVRSGADGSFVLPLPPGRAAVEAVVASAGYVAGAFTLEPRPDRALPTVVRLRPGARVRGVLVDERGAPCGGCRVRLESVGEAGGGAMGRMVASATTNTMGHRWSAELRTREDGTFAFDDVLPAGPALVSAPDVPPLVGERALALRPLEQRFLALRCRAWSPDDELRGAAVDGRGAAAPGVFVTVLDSADDDARQVCATVARGDGAFRVLRPDGAPANVWLRAARAPGHPSSAAVGPVRWGAAGVALQLPRPVGLVVRVVDAEGGAAIERFAVRCVPTRGARSAAAGELRADGVHRAGLCELPDVAAGPHELAVVPRDPRWLANLPVDVDVPEGAATEVRVALHRAVLAPVRVHTRDGAPVAGARVQAILPGAGAPVRDLADVLVHGGARSRPDVRVDAASTGDDGVAWLRLAPALGALELRVDGADRPPHVARDVQVTAAGCELVVPSRGWIRLALDGAGGQQVALLGDDGEALPNAWSAPLRLDDEGRATVPVAAGRWRVVLRAPAVAAGGPLRDVALEFGEVAVADGETAVVQRDVATALAPGAVHGRAFVDGAPATQVVLRLGAEQPDGRTRAVHELVAAPDERGAFRFDGVRAGAFALQLRSTSAGGTVAVPCGGWRALAAGAEHDVGPVEVATSPVELTVRDGEAVASGLLILRGEAGGAVLAAPLDGDGAARFERVPAGRYRVQLRRGRESRALGAVDVGAGEPLRRTLRD